MSFELLISYDLVNVAGYPDRALPFRTRLRNKRRSLDHDINQQDTRWRTFEVIRLVQIEAITTPTEWTGGYMSGILDRVASVW